MQEETTAELTTSIREFVELGNEVGPPLMRVLLLLLLALVSAGYLGRLLGRGLVRLGVPERRALFPVTLLHIVMLLIFAAVVLVMLGYPVINLLRFTTGIALAVTAVFVILRPYLPSFPMSRGDVISFGSIMGEVEAITFANTTIRTVDGKTVFVPNHKLLNDPLVNLSLQPHRRADIEFCISYDEDLDRVKEIVAGTLNQDERVVAEPAPVIAVTGLAPRYREMMVRFWASGEGFLGTQWALREKIDRALTTEGIQLGVPRVEILLADSANPSPPDA